MTRRPCAQCGEPFDAVRSTAKYCSPTCRSRHRRRPAEETAQPGLVGQVETELKRLGKLHSLDGQQALVVAQRMASGAETGQAVSSLSKELSRLMAIANARAGELDPIDEVTKRREQKAARARSSSR